MDGNKDESERCISLGLRCASDGDFEKALKYLNKAERLYPSQKAKDFIERLEAERMRRSSRGSEDASESKQESNGHVPRRDKSPGREDHRRKSSGFAKFREKMDGGASSSSSSSTKVSCEYTQEQVEAVRKIKKCKDYYEILSLTKEATDGELKKQYRKLALQFHPDKNKAPGAADAFKAIGNAFAVLSDPQKRRQYDLYGSEEHQRSQRQASSSYYSDGDGYYYDYSRGFEGDISAEEIFNMFFGGGFPSGNVYVRRQHRHREANFRGNESQNQNEPSGYNVLLQMMPVLVLLCLSLMSSFFVADPAYSLIRTQRHPYERKTANLKVPYFVKENFQKDYRGSIAKIESNVEEEFISNLKDACYRERSYKHILLARARSFGDAHLEEKAKSMKTPSCVQLEELSQQHSFW